MTSRSTKSCKDSIHRQDAIARAMHQCRAGTLALFEGIDYATFCNQAHPDFSPVGWHLGHIAYIEAYWLLERCAGMPPLFPEYQQLFLADGLPKTQRVNLPPLSEVRYYLDAVREKVLCYLKTAELDRQERLWRWLIQHESQHNETITFLLQLQHWNTLKSQESGSNSLAPSFIVPHSVSSYPDRMIEIPAGEFEQGNDSIDAMDNERSVHRVTLETYWIDRYPVTCGQYRKFMEAGGYENRNWWSPAGWEWLQSQVVTQPLYWLDYPHWDNHPVCGVSWYEAEAYSQFVGKRLPTEAEWEKAASWDAASGCRRTYPWGEEKPALQHCNHTHVGEYSHAPLQTTPVDSYPIGQSTYGCYDMLGNVWEWTDSWFDAYGGFKSYPYVGYSQVYFDQHHRVLKGGSWATRPWALRSSFRNWYHPGMRQLLAGFRCARSAHVASLQFVITNS